MLSFHQVSDISIELQSDDDSIINSNDCRDTYCTTTLNDTIILRHTELQQNKYDDRDTPNETR